MENIPVEFIEMSKEKLYIIKMNYIKKKNVVNQMFVFYIPII